MNTILLSSHRSDEELYLAFFETCDWAVYGQGGQVLCVAPSLRCAIDRAEDYAFAGAIVVALCRLPHDSIVIFAAQLTRLRSLIEEREADPVQHRWLAASFCRTETHSMARLIGSIDL